MRRLALVVLSLSLPFSFPLPAGALPPALPGPPRVELVDGAFSPSPVEPGKLLAGAASRHALLRVEGPVTPAFLARLETAGVHVVEPFAGRLLVVRLDAAAAHLPRPLRERVTFYPLPPAERRLAPLGRRRVRRILTELATPSGTVDRVRVRAFPGSDVPGLLARVEAAGGRVLRELPDGGIVEVPDSVLPRVASWDGVAWIGPAPARRVPLNDRSRAVIHATEVAGAPYGLDGSGQVAGIWDVGPVSPDHPDFGSRVTWPAGQGTAHCASCDHPTHVAGTMVGDGSQSAAQGYGNRQYRGMAPAATLVSWDYNGILATEYTEAYRQYGVRVANNSWGACIDPDDPACYGCEGFGSYTDEARSFDNTVRELPGMLVVFAAGNERKDGICGFSTESPWPNWTSLTPPSTAKNVVTVGAVWSDGERMTDFSSWGPTRDGRLKPDVVADGQWVTSCNDPDGYAMMAGTSMASPAVAGAALLLRQAMVDDGKTEPAAAALKALLIHGAEDLDDTAGAAPGPDYATGWGLVNIRRSVDLWREGALVEGTVADGGETTFELDVPAGTATVKATVAWTDPPASSLAATKLVHDLDLELVDPDGEVHYPWSLDPADPSAPAVRSGPNHLDNVEQVLVENPAPGTWTVRVRGTSVAGGEQAFALVTTPAGADANPAEQGFRPLAPAAGKEFRADDAPPRFSWDPGDWDEFRVVVRRGTKKVLTSGRRWLTGSSWTPSGKGWQRLLRKATKGQLNWVVEARVRGQKKAGATTDPRSFSLAAAEAPVITAPDDGSTWPAAGAPPTFTWDGGQAGSFRVTWSASSSMKGRKASGKGFHLSGTSWTPPADRWAKMVKLARKKGHGSVWVRVLSRDAARRKAASAPIEIRITTGD